MPDTTEAIPDTHTLMGWVNAFFDLGPRRPGHPAATAAEELTERVFGDVGLTDIRRDPISLTCWDAQSWSLELEISGKWEPFRSFYVPYAELTPKDGIETKAVYVGDGSSRGFARRNVKGTLVVADVHFTRLRPGLMKLLASHVCDPEGYFNKLGPQVAVWGRPNFLPAYERARDAGAAGFLGLLRDLPAGDTYYGPYDGFERALPGLYLGRVEAARFMRCLTGRPNAKVRFSLRGKRWKGATSNVLGWVRGTSDETILVGSHTDGPFASAVEDASGMAALFGIASALAKTAGGRKRSLLFLGSAGHFAGSCGARHILRHQADTLLEKVVCELHIEHICRAAEPLSDGRGYRPTEELEPRVLFVSPKRRLQRVVGEIVDRHQLARTMVLPAGRILGHYPPTDGGFYAAANIPIINYIAGPPYLLSEDDRPEFVADFEMQRVVAAMVDLLERLDRIPARSLGKRAVNRRRLTRFLDSLDGAGTEPMMRRLRPLYWVDRVVERVRQVVLTVLR